MVSVSADVAADIHVYVDYMTGCVVLRCGRLYNSVLYCGVEWYVIVCHVMRCSGIIVSFCATSQDIMSSCDVMDRHGMDGSVQWTH